MNKLLVITLMTYVCRAAFAQESVLHIYNWSDYITDEIITDFENETNIKIVYDVFDSNEILEAKLFSGGSGYDLVAPSSQFLSRQIKAGVFQQLDKNKLPNWRHLDERLLEKIQSADPNNTYAVPYLWGTTGIGYNTQEIKKYLGLDTIDSWAIFFNPENLSKLKNCGVAVLDAPQEIVAAALHYQGENPNPNNKQAVKDVEYLLMQIRPYISYFHSSKYITDLADGAICIALGWSGDILQSKARAREVGNNIDLNYIVPKEGAAAFFDMMVIPFDAPNPDAAHTFLNFILRPENIARISNSLWYANANKDAKPFVNEEIVNNPNIYPPDEVMDKIYIFMETVPEVRRQMMRSWSKIKTSSK